MQAALTYSFSHGLASCVENSEETDDQPTTVPCLVTMETNVGIHALKPVSLTHGFYGDDPPCNQ